MTDIISKELDLPVNYFFCETEDNATLACLIDKLDDDTKPKLIQLSESGTKF